jgi:HSP20 family molecular chaperone IbpA
LPEQIDENKEIKAISNKGILEITLPKAKQSQTKKITVKSNEK